MDTAVNAKSPAPRLHFGPFTLDLNRAELTREGAPVALRPKTFSLLKHLVTQAGRAVSKEELLDKVWPGLAVTDDSLSQCIAELRAALGDSGPLFIKTLPRVGYRFDAPVSEEAAAPVNVESPATQPSPSPSSLSMPAQLRPAKRLAFGAAAALVVLLLGGAWALNPWTANPPRPQSVDAEIAALRSIAVMPLTDLSEPRAPHLAEGITADITTDIGRLPSTLVMAMGSAAKLQADGILSVKRVGSELGVRHVLTGSVERSGDELRLHVQLSRTDTGALLWSERFEGSLTSDWRWRRDIAQRIAATMKVKLQEVVPEPARLGVRSSQAMDQWMRGDYLGRRFKTQAELLQARQHFEAALAIEPESVNALTGLAYSHICEVLYLWSSDREGQLNLGKAIAAKALAIDPNNSDALGALGGAHLFASELDDALRIYSKELAINPNDAHAHRDMAAVLYFQGRFTEMLPHVEMAIRLNPLETSNLSKAHGMFGGTLVALGRDDAAFEHFQLARDNEPLRATRHFDLAAVEALRGHGAQASKHLADALRLRPGSTLASLRAAEFSKHPAYSAGRQRHYEGLRLAGLPAGDALAAASPASGAVKQ